MGLKLSKAFLHGLITGGGGRGLYPGFYGIAA